MSSPSVCTSKQWMFDWIKSSINEQQSRLRSTKAHLQAGRGDLQVLADVVAVQHSVDVRKVDLLVGELSTVLQDWLERGTSQFLVKMDGALRPTRWKQIKQVVKHLFFFVTFNTLICTVQITHFNQKTLNKGLHSIKKGYSQRLSRLHWEQNPTCLLR